MLLNVTDGARCQSLPLKGELFSSPVIWKDKIVVGSRDDHLYIVKYS